MNNTHFFLLFILSMVLFECKSPEDANCNNLTTEMHIVIDASMIDISDDKSRCNEKYILRLNVDRCGGGLDTRYHYIFEKCVENKNDGTTHVFNETNSGIILSFYNEEDNLNLILENDLGQELINEDISIKTIVQKLFIGDNAFKLLIELDTTSEVLNY